MTLGYLVANGICGVLGQFCLTVALKVEEAGLVSLARTVDIVMAFVFQIIGLPEEEVDWTSILGAVIVCTAVSLSAFKNGSVSVQQNSRLSGASSTADPKIEKPYREVIEQMINKKILFLQTRQLFPRPKNNHLIWEGWACKSGNPESFKLAHTLELTLSV